MNKLPTPDDLRVFITVVRKSSFSAAADELGSSPAYISKRIRILEEELSTRLFKRTTRSVVVTEEGERVYHWAQRILDDIDHLLQEVSITRQVPRGAMRICSSFGFGRNVVGPAISTLIARYPLLTVRFEVFDRLVDVASEGFDLDIRVGDEIAPHLHARRLASNHRVLCASPAYLQRRGHPHALSDLAQHDCLVIKERDHPFGVWKLRNDNGEEQTVKVTGPLSTNHGEVAVRWAIDGRGVVLRSIWDIGQYLESGQLVRVLPTYQQEANIWAVYPSRLSNSAKVRVCVEFLQEFFADGHAGRDVQ
ncbi:LysR substrate-binding domain-containing protein [Glaciimonas sp. PCH181]|uniref:LysR substrate-binding domain-containing protein n=1 Tax=Glaciimonas sp. PCH181 TaxID=2133943 RepID=UPI000D3B1F0D|nr:LysR substrate-binding domain-containing protein [Glaciimonas sp. PCH181]PUA19321.1 LysR family transcriptional regulator [Glaciimonas sp. PCH181]